jgi:hypothetical protein
MNIPRLEQEQRVAKGMIASISSRRKPETAARQDTAPGSDRVRMSTLARMISQQSEALLDLHRPRPEMVRKFSEFSLSDAIPDTAVDAIFQRLVDT